MSRRLKLVVLATISLVVVPSIVSTYIDIPGTAAYAQGPFRKKNTGDDQAKQDDTKKQEDNKKQEDAQKKLEAQRQADADRAAAAEKQRQEDAKKREQEQTTRAEKDNQEQLKRAKEEQDRQAANQRKIDEDRRAEADRLQKAQERANQEAQNKQNTNSQTNTTVEKPPVRPATEPVQPTHPRGSNGSTGTNNGSSGTNTSTERVHTDTPSGRTADSTPTRQKDKNTSKYERPQERKQPERHHRKHNDDYYPYDPGYYPDEQYPYDPRQPYPEPPVVIYVPVPQDPNTPTTPTDPVSGDQLIVPMPSTPEQAFDQLSQAWLQKKPELLLALLPDNEKIKVYNDSKFSKEMDPKEFYSITEDAILEYETEVFWFRSFNTLNGKVRASGIHTFKGSDGKIRRSDISYTIEQRSGRWVITETGFSATSEEQEIDKSLTQQKMELILTKFCPIMAAFTIPDSSPSTIAAIATAEE